MPGESKCWALKICLDVHPVIHLDFSFCAANTYAGFMEGFPNTVKQALL